jgi:uncharacterized membrane protein YukC
MNRAALALIIAFSFSVVTGIGFVNLADANPIGSVSVPVPSIGISYPPDPPMTYENSTVDLAIFVRLSNDAPRLKSISYSLDGKPLVYLENLTVHVLNDFGPDLQDFTAYSVEAKLENLSEGNHTVTAYASDMSISRTFTVNSHYQVTVIKIFSPVNQTYSKTVPLVFAVNGEVKEAHYYMYRTRLWRNYEAVFEKHFDGNITLDNLYDGNYIMHLYVTTEKGEATTSTYFTISNSNFLENPSVGVGITAMGVFAIILGTLVYFKKRKHQPKFSAITDSEKERLLWRK